MTALSDKPSPVQKHRETYSPKRITEAEHRRLIYEAIVAAPTSTAGRAFRPA
jgi:hypothetical protein